MEGGDREILRKRGGVEVQRVKLQRKKNKCLLNDSSLKSRRKERKGQSKGEEKEPSFLYYSNSTHPRFLSFAPSASNNQVHRAHPPLFYLCLSISVFSQPISCAIHFLPLICANPCCAAVLFMCLTPHLSTLSLSLSLPLSLTPPLSLSLSLSFSLSLSLSALPNVLFLLLYCADGGAKRGTLVRRFVCVCVCVMQL